MLRLNRTANRNPLRAPLHRAFVPSAYPNQGVQRKQKRGPLAIAAAKCVFYRSLPAQISRALMTLPCTSVIRELRP